MKHGIYMYYDRVAESFVKPILAIAPNDEAAIRDFVGMLVHPEFPKDKRVGDYDLVRLASYDLVHNKVCEVVADPSGNPLCTGVQVRAMIADEKRKQRLELEETERGEADPIFDTPEKLAEALANG